MHRVAAKFVPCLLTEEQKQYPVTVSQELLDRWNTDEDFLKNVITGEETWVYGYDVETKVQLPLKILHFSTCKKYPRALNTRSLKPA